MAQYNGAVSGHRKKGRHGRSTACFRALPVVGGRPSPSV